MDRVPLHDDYQSNASTQHLERSKGSKSHPAARLDQKCGNTRDLQEIELLALNAKNLIYKVSRQMQKTVNSVMGEEIVATNVYHSLTRENSELLRRYCFYLKLDIKLKIQQL